MRMLVQLRDLALLGDGEQFVGEVHQDAVVAGGMVAKGGFEFGSHQRRVASGLEQMLKACAEVLAGDVIEDETATDATAKREQFGRAQALGQAGVAGKDDTEELARVEVLGGEHAEFVEDWGQNFLGFIDDEDGSHEGLCNVLTPASA